MRHYQTAKAHGLGAQVRGGFVLGCKVVGVILWGVLVAAGVGMTFSDSLARLYVGGACLIFSAVVAVATAEFWVGLLPGLLGLEVLNTAIALFDGYAPISPNHPIPRSFSLVALLALVASAVAARTLESRPLGPIDRIALLIFLVLQVLAISSFPSLLVFAVMPLPLLVAWGNAYLSRTK